MANLELGVANSPADGLRHRLDLQAVHGLLDPAAGARGQALARRRHPQVAARDAVLRQDDHDPPPAPPHERAARLPRRDGAPGVQEEDLDHRAGRARHHRPPEGASNFPPGQEHLYSNTGYFLLGVIVKRASGQSLREFAAERIFVPLGMRHTQFNELAHADHPQSRDGVSEAQAGGFGIEMSNWEQIGDGSVLTTVEDLQRWDQNFYEPRVRRREAHRDDASRGRPEQRQEDHLCVGPDIGHVSRPPHGLPRRRVGGLSRPAPTVSRSSTSRSPASATWRRRTRAGWPTKVAEVYIGGSMAHEETETETARQESAKVKLVEPPSCRPWSGRIAIRTRTR